MHVCAPLEAMQRSIPHDAPTTIGQTKFRVSEILKTSLTQARNTDLQLVRLNTKTHKIWRLRESIQLIILML
jgi:hypothetical protein